MLGTKYIVHYRLNLLADKWHEQSIDRLLLLTHC